MIAAVASVAAASAAFVTVRLTIGYRRDERLRNLAEGAPSRDSGGESDPDPERGEGLASRTVSWHRVVLLVLAVGGGTIGASMASASAPAVRAFAGDVPVVRCRTTFGIPPGKVTVPARVHVRGVSRSTPGLAAYSNTEEFLVGPAGMDCAGAVGADGNGEIVAWPRGGRRPRQHSVGDGLTLILIPACGGCQASDACPFFMAFARGLGFPCTSGVPAGEQVDRLDSHLTRFEDPPGVAGDGWPSGGRDLAQGLVGIKGRLRAGPYERSVYRSTCTLPKNKAAVCALSLNAVIQHYG